MKITENIHFFEGDYIDKTKTKYSDYYKGIGSSNFIILKGKEQVLIDSGIHVGPHIPRLNRQLVKEGIHLINTSKVVFSHAHPDHVLYAKKLSRQKNIEFYIHKHTEPQTISSDYFFESFFNFPISIQREVYKMPKYFLKLYLKCIGYNFRYLKIKAFFEDEFPFDFEIPIEPVHMPGHTTGHIGFYFPTEKIFYSADLFDTRSNPGASIGSSDSDYLAALNDIERVSRLDIEIMLPGHGRPIFGKKEIKAFLNQLMINTKRYPKIILKKLPSGKDDAVTLSKLTREIYPDSIACNGFIRHIITYNCLKHLQREKKVGSYYKNRVFHWYKERGGSSEMKNRHFS